MSELGGPISFCGIDLRHPLINASGTFDVIAARRAFGDAVLERFPFSAYVSKTITPASRVGNEPPPALGGGDRDGQLDRVAEQGARRFHGTSICH